MREPGLIGKRFQIEKEFVVFGLIGSVDDHVPPDGQSVVRLAGEELSDATAVRCGDCCGKRLDGDLEGWTGHDRHCGGALREGLKLIHPSDFWERPDPPVA